jgi:prepilin-type N-terminal cleavage/methylation domain-containing protein
MASAVSNLAPFRRPARRGFTLLELVLAIALTGVVMLLVGMAIDLHLRGTERRQNEVARAQLVRAILQQMATDLRGTVRADTTDFSGVQDLAGSAGADLELPIESGSGPVDPSGETGNGQQPGAEDAGAELEEEPSISASDISSAVVVTPVPGLYGNRNQLLVDVSHLPGREVLARIAAGEVMTKPMGDVQSVAYYLARPGQPTAAQNQTGATPQFGNQPDAQITGGLVRRVVDRAELRWAGDSGTLNSLLNHAELTAPEVRALEFRYFDGTQWVEEWDSKQLQSLPVAVEIAIALAPIDDPDSPSAGIGLQLSPGLNDPGSVFRMVVRIPTGRPVDEEALANEPAADATSEEMEAPR